MAVLILIIAGTFLAGILTGILAFMLFQRKSSKNTGQISYFQQLIDNSNAMICEIDQDGRFLYINSYYKKIMGYEPKDLIGRTAFEIGRPVRRAEAEEKMQSASNNEGNTQTNEWEFIDKAGKWHWVEAHSRSFTNAKGELRISVISFDVTERINMETRLKVSEDRYRNMAELLPDTLFIHENGKIIYINPAGIKLFGAESATQLIGKKMQEIVHPDYQNTVKKRIEDAVSGINFKTGWEERKFLRLDGTPLDVEVFGVPVATSGGTLFQIIARDITERKITENKLRESESDYKSLFNNMIDGLAVHEIILDENGKPCDYRFLAANPAFEQLTGLPREAVIGKTVMETMPETEKYWIDSYAKVALEGTPIQVENYSREINKYFRVSAYCPKRGLFATIIEDITDRKLSEKKLINFTTAVEQGGSIIIITDISGNIEYINQKFTKITGYTAVEVLGKNPRFLKSGDKTQEDYRQLWNTIEAGKDWHGEFHNKRKDSTLYWESASISPILDPEGKIVSYMAIKEDITQRKEAQEKLMDYQKRLEDLNQTLRDKVRQELGKNREKDLLLIQQSRLAAMGEMVHNIAHQWRQPLNAVGILIQNVGAFYDAGRLTKEFLKDKIDKSMGLIIHMSRTIDDFKNFFKQDKEKQTFSLNESVQRVYAIMEDSYRNNSMGLEITVTQDTLVSGYPNEYSQALLNILSNAKEIGIERNVSNLLVKINIFCEAASGVVTVSDNAGGIKPETLSRIFDPYFTTKEHGTGIGLYMSKMIIEKNMAGELTAQNIPGGAVFRLELPEEKNKESTKLK